MIRFILLSTLVRNQIYAEPIRSTQTSTFQINVEKNTAVDQILDIKLTQEDKANLLTHGCWCVSLLGQGINSNSQNGGPPVDELDTICKKWLTDRHCNDKLIGGLCYDLNNNSDLDSSFYEINSSECNLTPSSDSLLSKPNGFSTCELSSCQLDNYYSNKISNFLSDNENFIFDSSKSEQIYCSKFSNGIIPPSHCLPGDLQTDVTISFSRSNPPNLKRISISLSEEIFLTNARFDNGRYWGDWVVDENGEYFGGGCFLPPGKAIDGEFTNKPNCQDHAHSFEEETGKPPALSKFLVDLKDPSIVNKIKIYPRKDCCWHRYLTMKVYIVDFAGNEITCEPTDGLPFDENYVKARLNDGIDFDCPGKVTSSIFVTNEIEYLQIVEIVAL